MSIGGVSAGQMQREETAMRWIPRRRVWQAIQNTILTDEPDRLSWKWTANGAYMASSSYHMSFEGSTSCQAWKLVWRNWAPPRVKFFHWLANLDRCWTADHLARRGLQHHSVCLLCGQAPETMQHLILACPFSRQVWHEVLSWLRFTCTPPDQEGSLMEWWSKAYQETPKPLRKGQASMTLLMPWMVWKQRNDWVFEGAQPSIDGLVSRIKDETKLWARAGATGLRVVLPSTWDVHQVKTVVTLAS